MQYPYTIRLKLHSCDLHNRNVTYGTIQPHPDDYLSQKVTIDILSITHVNDAPLLAY